MFRVGFGYDSHRLVSGRKLVVGGIEIPFEKGSLGHSDGDALIHAICDALLGSLSLRDIGYHFPNTDPQYKGIQSIRLLEKVCDLVNDHGYVVNNIDSTISLETPKLSSFIPNMKTMLAEASCLTEEDISIKATTTEKLGFTGRKEGIAAYTVVLVKKV